MKEYGREKFEKREKARLIEERKRNRLMIKSKFIYLEEQIKEEEKDLKKEDSKDKRKK